uniref:Uncharacterized protein n=1 Tax=Rhizophora mucronata TaxID=61149 RepID=A0A2P2N4K0_RHIMU
MIPYFRHKKFLKKGENIQEYRQSLRKLDACKIVSYYTLPNFDSTNCNRLQCDNSQ